MMAISFARRVLYLSLCLGAAACAPRASEVKSPESSHGEAAPVALSTTSWVQDAGDVQLSAHARGGRDGGPAILVLHGGPGLSHEYTRPLERIATADLRVIGFDQRGVGASTPPPLEAFGLANHVCDVEVLRRHQGVERIHLLGHSWGGLVAMAYAAEHPRNVASLMLVDSVAPTRALWRSAQDHFKERERRLVDEGLVPAMRPIPVGPDCSARVIAVLPVYYANPRHAATKDLAGSSCRTGVFETTMLETGDWDYLDELAALSTDALIVQGAEDPFGREGAEAIASAMPKAKKVVLPGCGHLPWEECADGFFAALEGFVHSVAK